MNTRKINPEREHAAFILADPVVRAARKRLERRGITNDGITNDEELGEAAKEARPPYYPPAAAAAAAAAPPATTATPRRSGKSRRRRGKPRRHRSGKQRPPRALFGDYEPGQCRCCSAEIKNCSCNFCSICTGNAYGGSVLRWAKGKGTGKGKHHCRKCGVPLCNKHTTRAEGGNKYCKPACALVPSENESERINRRCGFNKWSRVDTTKGAGYRAAQQEIYRNSKSNNVGGSRKRKRRRKRRKRKTKRRRKRRRRKSRRRHRRKTRNLRGCNR